MKRNVNSIEIGMALALIAAVSMATIGVFSRFSELPAVTVAFYRLILGAAFMALWILLRKGSLHCASEDRVKLVFSGGFLAGFICCYIEAMNRTTMANAILIVYLAPILAAILSRIFFSELIRKSQMVSMGIAFIGLLVMQDMRTDSAINSFNSGIMFAPFSMIFYSLFIVNNRFFSGKTTAANRTFWQLTIGAAFILPIYLSTQLNLTAAVNNLGWLMLIGFLPGFIAIYSAVVSLQKLPTTVYGTITYAEPVSVIVFGWLLFSETLTLQQLFGAVLIIGGGIGQAIIQAKNGRLIKKNSSTINGQI